MTTTAHQPTVDALFHEINRGTEWREIGDAIGAEHGYLVNQFSQGWARGILRKCWPDKTCGQVMYLLANGPNFDHSQRTTSEYLANQAARQDHPYHDGELTCNVVRAALLVFSITNWHASDAGMTYWRGEF